MKLYELLKGNFILLQDDGDEEGEEYEEGEDHNSTTMSAMDDGGSEASESESDSESGSEWEIVPGSEIEGSLQNTSTRSSARDSPATSACSSSEDAYMKEAIGTKTILANKRAHPLFGKMHRSKGTLWFATRPRCMGGWSTAGAMLQVTSEQPWFCEMPEEDWSADVEVYAAIKADFVGEWGDRRNEIVFIGESLEPSRFEEALDACLLTDEEMVVWEKVMKSNKSERKKTERLERLWNDEYWAEWGKDEMDRHDHHHDHVHVGPHRY